MAGAQRFRKREEELPIAVVPKRLAEPVQLAVLEHRIAHTNREIASLTEYARSIRVDPGETGGHVDRHCDRLARGIDNLKIADLPLVGERFSGHAEWLKGTVAEAREAGKNGELGKFTALIRTVEMRTSALGRVLALQTSMLQAGVPENVRIAGMDDPFGSVLDSLAHTLKTVGTGNEGIFNAAMAAGELYAKNAQLYNADNLDINRERDRLFAFILAKGGQAASGRRYTEEDSSRDDAALRRFRDNAASMEAQLRSHNVAVLSRRRDSAALRLSQTADLQMKEALAALEKDMDSMLAKARRGKMLEQTEMAELSRRYHRLVEGREAPRSDSEWLEDLTRQAAEMQAGRPAREGAPGWYGMRALQLIEGGNERLAALAVAMGRLDAGTSGKIMDYLPSYLAMRDAIERGSMLTPGMMSRYSHDIEFAAMMAETDRLGADMRRAVPAASRELALSVLPVVRARMEQGDAEGAGRLLGMARTYGDLLLRHRRGGWTGSDAMTAALASEKEGRNAQETFSNALASYSFGEETTRFRRAVSDWSRTGMRAYLQTVNTALMRTEELARNGKVQEARELLTLTAMYADSVERLGVRGRRGIVYSVPAESARAVDGMQTAIGAIAGGRHPAGIERRFMESFNQAQTRHIENAIESLSYRARTRATGRAQIDAAYEEIRARAGRGDFKGAYTLLDLVQEFYGKQEGGRTEGWRYRRHNPTYPGYSVSMAHMLGAIRMEIGARTPQESLAAARLLDRGTMLAARTFELQTAHSSWNSRYHGRAAFVEGRSGTRGRIPMGEQDSRGNYPAYIDLAKVRSYERENPKDRQLREGRTLETLLGEMEKSAGRGDAQAYLAAERAFMERLGLVSNRAARRESIELWISRVKQMGVEPVRKQLGAAANTPAIRQGLDRFEREAGALTSRLERLRNTEEDIPLGECMRMAGAYRDTLKRVGAYVFLSEQLKLQQDYMSHMGAGTGPRAGQANEAMKQAATALRRTRDRVLGATPGEIMSAYRRYAGWRKTALALYSAQGQQNIEAARWNYEQRYENIMNEFFGELLTGDPTPESMERRQRMFQALVNVEVSVFGVPAPNPSQRIFANLSRLQYDVMDRAGHIAYRADVKWADEMLKEQGTAIKELLKRSNNAAFWGNVATAGTYLAATLLNPPVGGALFTTMAWDNVATQISVQGSATWQSWAILGVTAATMGFAGFASAARFSATSLEQAGYIAKAAQAARVATAAELTLLGIGAGFAGYAGYESYRAFSKGQHKEGIFLAGMALFPATVGGIAAVKAVRARRAARTEAREMQEILGKVRPEERPVRIEAAERAAAREPLLTREGLVAFLRRYIYTRADDAGRRAMLREVPVDMRKEIFSLSRNPAVIEGLREGAVMTRFGENALMNALGRFQRGPRPTRPGGPGGTRPQWELSSLMGEQGLGPFRQLLGDLAVADGAPAARLNARTAARARLEALRAENPKAAEVIDGLVRNPTVRDAVANNVWDSTLANRMMERGRAELQKAIPREVLAAENQATMAYQQQLLMAAGAEGQPIMLRTMRPGAPGAMRTRATGEGGGGPRELTPGTVAGAGGVAAGGRAASGQRTRIPAEETQQPLVLRKERGAVREWVRNRIDSVKQRRADRKAEEAAARQQSQELAADLAGVTEPALREIVANALHPTDQAAYLARLGRSGELTQAELQSVAGSVRTAPQRLADIVKSAWNRIHDRSTPAVERMALWNLLAKIYAHENVRGAFDAMFRVEGYQVLGTVARRVDESMLSTAGRQRMTLDTYRQALAKRGFRDEMPLLVDMIEGQSAMARAQMQRNATSLESRVHKLEGQVRAAETRLTRRSTAGRQASLDRLRGRLSQTQGELEGLKARLADPENMPLAHSQRLLGIEFTPAQRVAALKKLQDSGILSGGEMVSEVQHALGVAGNRLQSIDVANRPIARAMRNQMERSLLAENMATGLDDVLLNALRSDEAVKAITRGQPAKAKELYLTAVKEGNLAEVLTRLKDAMGDSQLRQITGFVERARSELGGQYTVMNGLAGRYASAVAEGDFFIPLAGTQTMPVRHRLREFGARIWASNWARVPLLRWWSVDGRQYSMATQYFARRGAAVLRDMPRSAPFRMPKTAGWLVMQTAAWAASGYAAYRLMRWMLTETPEKVVDLCRKDYGVQCTTEQISFIQNTPGVEFFGYLSRKVLEGTELRPGSPDALRRALESGQWHLNIEKLGDLIDIGREMTSQLPMINQLLRLSRQGATEDIKTAAKEKLGRMLGAWGISIQAVDDVLKRKEELGVPQRLSITDMVDLGREHFRSNGLMITTKDAMIGQFLTDAGIPFQRDQGHARFLSENTDIFMELWSMVQRGNLPRTRIKDAIGRLSEPGKLRAVRENAEKGGVTLGRALAEPLDEFYLKTPIPSESFLDRMDEAAVREPDAGKRAALQNALTAYLADSRTMQKLNRFIISNDEMIYGDRIALARWITEYAGTDMVNDARRLGYVGSVKLSGITKFSPALQMEIARFVNEKSNQTNQGIMPWVNANENDITDLPAILQYLATQGTARTMTPAEYYTKGSGQLVNQEQVFIRNGWMRRLTRREAAARRREARPSSPARNSAEFERLDRDGRIQMLREMPPKDRAAMVKAFTPRQKQMYEQLPRNVRIISVSGLTATAERQGTAAPETKTLSAGLTPEMQRFYSTEGGKTLAGNLAAVLSRMASDEKENSIFLTIYLGTAPSEEQIKEYSRPAKRKQMMDAVGLLVMGSIYEGLAGKGAGGVLEGAGITGKMEEGGLQVKFDDKYSPMTLEGYIRTFIITPEYRKLGRTEGG